MISNRVMKSSEFPDAVYYKVECDCGGDDHMATIELEYDKDLSDISMNFYKKVYWSSHWGNYNWFERTWKRITAATKILFTGWIELEESFLIRGGDHLDTFIEALEEGKRKLDNRDKENDGPV